VFFATDPAYDDYGFFSRFKPMGKRRKMGSIVPHGTIDEEFEKELEFTREYERVEQERIDQAIAEKINAQVSDN